jgi:hypothetical protein
VDEYIPTDVKFQGSILYSKKQRLINLPKREQGITYIVNPNVIEHLKLYKVDRPDCITYKEGKYIGHSKVVEV